MMARSIRSGCFRAVFILAAGVALAGCSFSPVGVKRRDPVEVHNALTANALTENRPSIESLNVLHRYDLFYKNKKAPGATLAELHRIVLADDDDATWFALAELSFLHAERTHDRRYAIMAALYAWSYLFGGAPPDPFDPRLRVATDLYNRGVTVGLEVTRERGVVIQPVEFDLPIGRLHVEFDESTLVWNGRRLRDFVPVAELDVRGMSSRFRTPGIGAPLAASAAVESGKDRDAFLARRLKIPVTALVRAEDVRRQISSGDIRARLELYSDPDIVDVTIGDRRVPLEKEPTAVLASMVAESPVVIQELKAFIGAVTQRSNQGRLVSLRPHVRGRIPVVFVHGTGSSPARWAEMVNVLDNDPRIRARFEPWFFSYNSSSPIAYSAYLLRKSLTDAVEMLDPEGTDTNLRSMVVMGHSQGGLLTKMTAIRSGSVFWDNYSRKPFEKVKLDDEDRKLVRDIVFVEPLPFVKRVIFLCTPHRGSFLAASAWVRRLIERLVTLPVRMTTLTASLVLLNPDIGPAASMKTNNAVDNMSPGNRFIKTLAEIPVSPEVKANSIVAVIGNRPLEEDDDGVVKYRSAHVDGVESQLVVKSPHSAQALPATIEEVRRILLLHAEAHPVSGGAAPQIVKPAPAGGVPSSDKLARATAG